MTGSQAGVWAPLTPMEVRAVFKACPVRWWVMGGWAIDLFLGSKSRAHDNIDVGLLRADQRAVQAHLGRWDMHVVSDRGLRPWAHGEPSKERADEVWCRREAGGAWLMRLVLNEANKGSWVYARNPRIQIPLDHLVAETRLGIPFLAVHVELLLKSESRRPKDQADLEAALPLLDTAQREWLKAAVANTDPENPWLRFL